MSSKHRDCISREIKWKESLCDTCQRLFSGLASTLILLSHLRCCPIPKLCTESFHFERQSYYRCVFQLSQYTATDRWTPGRAAQDAIRRPNCARVEARPGRTRPSPSSVVSPAAGRRLALSLLFIWIRRHVERAYGRRGATDDVMMFPSS